MPEHSQKRIRIAAFCGGRGAASLARELLELPHVHLSLIINGYDDGLSTGRLRRFIPGMLGISDFRKNLLHHLDPSKPSEQAMHRILEYRFPDGASHEDFVALLTELSKKNPPPADSPLAFIPNLPIKKRQAIIHDLVNFNNYYLEQDLHFDFSDCSLGNLVMAGMFLRCGEDFNGALNEFARLFGSRAQLVNINRGENSFLVALKENGELLGDEASIVDHQSPVPIKHLFLLEQALGSEEVALLHAMSPEEREAWLAARHKPSSLSPEAEEAVMKADLVIYCSGTQHSSLMPSYMTPGISQCIKASRAKARVMLVNIHSDHDIQDLSATDLVDRVLALLGDPHNESGLISHVLHHRSPGASSGGKLQLAPESRDYKSAQWLSVDLEHPQRKGIHCGQKTLRALNDILGDDVIQGRAG